MRSAPSELRLTPSGLGSTPSGLGLTPPPKLTCSDISSVGQRFPFPEDLVLENLALRRQLLALHAQQPRRRLTALHKLFWVANVLVQVDQAAHLGHSFPKVKSK